MIELITRTDVETQVRLDEVEAETKLSTINTTSQLLLEREMRLDAAYYSNESIQAQQLLYEWGLGTESLVSLTNSVFYPTRFKRIHTHSRVHGVPFLTPSMMLHFRPESKTYLAKRQDQLEKCTVQKDWLLITRSGSVGRCVIVGEHLSQFAVSDDAIRVRSKEMPVGYLYAYLMSWIGQALLTKDQYGATVKHLESHHVANIPVPILPEAEINEIAEGIQQAYDLREEANALLDDAMEMFYRELELPEFDENLVEYMPQPEEAVEPHLEAGMLRAFAMNASELDERFDASYHVPVVDSVISTLKKGKYELTTLQTMADDVRTPPRFKRIYVSPGNGVPFIRPSHLPQMTPYDLGYISKLTSVLDALELKHGDVLISTDGTVGRIGMVTNVTDGWAGSNNLGRVTCGNDNGRNGFVAAFLMSPYGQHQLLREIYGGVVDHIGARHIQGIFIPDAPEHLQERIGGMVVEAFEKKDEANIVERNAIQRLEDRLQGSRA